MNSLLQACATTLIFHNKAMLYKRSPLLKEYHGVMEARQSSGMELYDALQSFHGLCGRIFPQFADPNTQSDSEELFTSLMEHLNVEIMNADLDAGRILRPSLVDHSFAFTIRELQECQLQR
jgi:hypothetical protein